MAPAVVIPARDEAATVAGIVHGVLRALPGAAVVVVDDGSRDGTAGAASSAGARVVRQPRLGYARALTAGYRAALELDPEAIAQMDADGQHDPADLPRLLAALDAADLVVGSRFLDPHPYVLPPSRRAGIAACRWLARRVGGLALTDPTSGYRALRPAVAAHLAHEGFPGGLTETSLLISLHRRGIRLAEVGVRMSTRDGRSMNGGLAGPARLARIGVACLLLAARAPR